MSEQKVPPRSNPNNMSLPPIIENVPPPEELVDKIGRIPAFFLNNYNKTGSIYRFPVAPNVYFTVIGGPEANLFMSREGKDLWHARQFRKAQNDEYGSHKTLVSMDGKEHYHLRKIQKRGYSRTAIKQKYDQLIKITQEAIVHWQPNQSVLMRETLLPIIVKQIGRGVLNYAPDDYLPDLPLFLESVVRVTLLKQWPEKVLDTPSYKQAKQRSMELADETINAHHLNIPNHTEPDLVIDLLEAQIKEKLSFSAQELRIAVLGPYIGGIEPVVNTLLFLIYALLKHPDILAQVTAEADTAFVDDLPTPGALKKMQTLHYAIMETLRLYPVVPTLQGTVSRPFEFAGYRVEPGQTLLVCPTISHYLPELYPDPYHFDLDRYCNPRHEYSQPGAYAPFGVGRHLCLGAGLAQEQMMLFMATLLHTVTLALDPPGYRLKIGSSPMPYPADFRVRVLAR